MLCSVHWLCCIDCVLFTGCVVLTVFCSLAVMYWLYSPDTGCQGDQEAGEEPWSWVTALWCQGFVAEGTPGWFLGQPVVAMAITGARRFHRQSHAPEADQRCCILLPFGFGYAPPPPPPPPPFPPTGSLPSIWVIIFFQFWFIQKINKICWCLYQNWALPI